MSLPTLVDIALRNEATGSLIDEASRFCPEIGLLPVKPIKGLNYYTRVCTAPPTVQFRNANDGTDATKGTFENRLVETYILNPRWHADKQVADASEDGPEALLAEAGILMVNAAMAAICSQFYYGTDSDAKGFPGLEGSVDSSMVVDAKGNDAGKGSSVYAVTFGEGGVQLVLGMGGSIDLTEVRVADIVGDNGKPLTGYVQELAARIGLQVGNLKGLARLKNLTAQEGNSMTDDWLAELYSVFPVGHKPDAFLMSRRSRAQLQASRTKNGNGATAPLPTEWDGVPIVATDSISDTETIS